MEFSKKQSLTSAVVTNVWLWAQTSLFIVADGITRALRIANTCNDFIAFNFRIGICYSAFGTFAGIRTVSILTNGAVATGVAFTFIYIDTFRIWVARETRLALTGKGAG